MNTFSIILASFLAAQAAPVHRPGLASIDDAARGGIRDWHAEDDRGIYLRDRTNRWYYAAFRHNCPGVLYDQRIAFRTSASNRFDRQSLVQTETETCAVESVDRSDAPEAKGGKAAN